MTAGPGAVLSVSACAVLSRRGLPGHRDAPASLRCDAAALTVPFSGGDGNVMGLSSGPLLIRVTFGLEEANPWGRLGQ